MNLLIFSILIFASNRFIDSLQNESNDTSSDVKIKCRSLDDWQENRFNTDFCECKPVDIKPRIVNGTSIKKIGWLAVIYVPQHDFLESMRNGSSSIDDADPKFIDTVYFCFGSGVVINPKWILTAVEFLKEHARTKKNRPVFCVVLTIRPGHIANGLAELQKNEPRTPAGVAAGLDHDPRKIIYSDKFWSAIARVEVHPDFSMKTEGEHIIGVDHDIGLLEVRVAFEFGQETGIYPACLYSYKVESFPNDFIAAGHGSTESFEDTKFDNPKMLIYSQVENDCDPGVICVRSSYGASCSGDSGGPLHYFVDNKLQVVGIDSSGRASTNDTENTEACSPNMIEEYMGVSLYINYIENTVGSICH